MTTGLHIISRFLCRMNERYTCMWYPHPFLFLSPNVEGFLDLLPKINLRNTRQSNGSHSPPIRVYGYTWTRALHWVPNVDQMGTQCTALTWTYSSCRIASMGEWLGICGRPLWRWKCNKLCYMGLKLVVYGNGIIFPKLVWKICLLWFNSQQVWGLGLVGVHFIHKGWVCKGVTKPKPRGHCYYIAYKRVSCLSIQMILQ